MSLPETLGELKESGYGGLAAKPSHASVDSTIGMAGDAVVAHAASMLAREQSRFGNGVHQPEAE